jgi:hypothetical protein
MMMVCGEVRNVDLPRNPEIVEESLDIPDDKFIN